MTPRRGWSGLAACTVGAALAAQMSAQAGVDLTLEALDASGLTRDTQTLAVSGTLQATVRNLGSSGAGATALRAFEDRNGNGMFDATTDVVLGQAPVAPVGGLASLVVNIPIAGTQTFAGNIIYVEVDPANAVAETDEANNSRHTGLSSTFTVVGGSALEPVVLWERNAFTQQPAFRRVRSTPAVGDLDGDGYPEVVFITQNTLRAVDGRTGAERFSVVDTTLRVSTNAGVTLADLDADGSPEILTFDASCRAIVFNHDGTLRWRASEIGHGSCWSAVSVADLDADGNPEVIAGHHVYSTTGTWRWTASAGRGGPFGSMPVVADIDLDGELDVVMGNSAYRADGTVVYDRRATYQEAYPAVGNLDDDPEAEVVFKQRVPSRLVVLEHDGTTKWSVDWVGVSGGGAPTIADFDGDGRADIGVSGDREYRVYSAQGSLMWAKPIYDTSSGVTSSTVFDFDNDGRAEVVFGDEEYLYIWAGVDGTELFRTPRGSGTGAESPVVADVNADGHADIVVTRDGVAGLAGVVTEGIVVYTGANRNWANTRRIWSQPSYSITHINDDLTVPATFTPNWRVPGLNNFRLNTFDPRTGGAPDAAPNLTASFLRHDDRDFPGRTFLTVRVGNGGAVPASAAHVALTVDDVAVCTLSTSGLLAPGQFEDLTCAWVPPVAGARRVAAVVDPDDLVTEGDETDNTAAALLLVGVGPAETVDTLVVRARDGGAELRWTPMTGALSYNIYRRQGGGSYVLHRAAYVNAVGSFVDSGLTNNTVHWYNVRTVDANGIESPLGTEASATPIPRAQRGDTAPTITSQPVTRGRTNVPYAYQLLASDPDAGDTLAYALPQAPAGMTVDGAGRITWMPELAQAGPQRVLATVTDTRGRVTSQGFTIFIDTQFVNTPPSITSTAITTGRVGSAYAYTVVASDPDAGDVVSFVLDEAPAGMAVNATTGRITWMPGPTEVGTHAVSVTARDLSGYTDTQAFQVVVGNPNQQPAITSVAPTLGTIGVTLSYLATATDPDPGDVLSWTLVSGPEGATVDPTGLLLYTPTAVGPAAFTLQVSDVLGAFVRQSFTVQFGAVSNTAPVFTSTPVTDAEVDALYAYAARATDPDGDVLTYSLLTGPTGMTITPDGVLYWTPGPSAIGAVAVSVQVADFHGGVASQSFTITVAPIDTTAPVVAFSSPDAEAVVEGHVPIVGTASDPNLVSWSLDYQVTGASGWTLLAEGDTSVQDDVLATFPAGLLANRPYVLRLTARDGRQSIATQRRLVVGGSPLKLGAFTLEYTDLRVAAGAMPISIQRRYDSSRPYWNDFGTGWALGFSEVDLRVDGSYNVFLTLPSGREAAFAFAPQSLGFAGVSVNRYVPGAGVFDTLENLDCPNLMGGAGAVLCLSGAGGAPIGVYQPRRWRLTTADGTAYTIEDDRITAVEDRNGHWTSIGPAGITSSTGQSVQFVRDGSGRITQVIDARGARVLYAYDGQGRLVGTTDPAGVLTAYAYDGTSHLITEVTGDGGCQALRQEFDAEGRLSARIDAGGSRVSYSYDVPGRGLTTTYADGSATTETFNEAGDPVRFVDGEGHATTYGYDANRQRTVTELPSGRRLTRTYDASGNPLTASSGRAGGPQLTTTYAWTPDNLLDRITYPTGEYEAFAYDVRGNLTARRVHSAAGALVREHLLVYDAAGRVMGEQSDRGTFAYAYDGGGRLVTVTDGAGRVNHMAYDAIGQLVTVFGPDGAPVGIDYDAYGMPVAYRADQAVLYTQSWNAFGSAAAATDGAGASFAFTYDCSGALTAVDDPVGGHTAYSRNPFGAWTTRTDPLGRQTQRAYDRNGRLIASTSPAGDQVAHTWSPDGFEAARTTGLGTVTVTFDDHGRPLVQTEPGRTMTYTYDGRGRVTSIVSTGVGGGTHATTYDAAGAPLSVTDRFGQTVVYTYDLLGRRTTMTSPDGLVTTYTYDAGGRLARIATGAAWADMTWDAAGRRTSVAYSNGVRGDRTFDSAGRLQSLVWTGPGGSVIRSWIYSYDAAGRPVHAQLNDGSVSWTYDALGRLTGESISSAVGGSRSGSWAYDAVGNRLDAGASFGDDHRQTGHGGSAQTLTFDAAGNATRTVTGWVLGYDVFNRLVQTPFGQWRYNAVGLRDEGTSTIGRRYVYDGLNVLLIGNATTLQHRYTFGPDVDDILFVHDAAGVRFYVTDHVGSVVALTDAAGGVLRRHAYDAWGVNYHSTSVAGVAQGGANFNPFLFQSRELQTSLNIYDFRARVYDPALGRFLQKDPDPGTAWLPASRHPYLFALNSPLVYRDPLGESAVQYNLLLTRNPMARFGGAMAGFGAAFTGTTLSFLGHFLEAHLADPAGPLSGKATLALDAANSQMGEVLKRLAKLGKGSSVGKGMKTGATVGKFAASAWIAHAVQ